MTRAVNALGGLKRLEEIRFVHVHGTGEEFRSAQLQGPSPERQTSMRHEEWLTLDLAGNRASLEYHTPRHDGSDRWRRFMYAADQRTYVDMIS
ncbi:MAG: hypothetical protein ABI877_05115, partial [Gemmatimonadaceae bacterium]